MAIVRLLSNTLASIAPLESQCDFIQKKVENEIENMKKLLQLFILGSLVAALVVPQIAFADAAADYKAKCQGCHGPGGVPSEGMAKSMNLKPLGGADVQGMSDAELTAAISSGKGKMPGFKAKLSDEQVNDLVKYIRALKK